MNAHRELHQPSGNRFKPTVLSLLKILSQEELEQVGKPRATFPQPTNIEELDRVLEQS
jgi:hypothetical protein